MLSSTFRRAATAAASRSSTTVNIARRTMAQGPASGGEISDELLAKLGSLSTQALVDGLWVMGWPPAQIDGARPLHPSHKCVGRAVTLNFVPARPDIAQDKPPVSFMRFFYFVACFDVQNISQCCIYLKFRVVNLLNMKHSRSVVLMKYW